MFFYLDIGYVSILFSYSSVNNNHSYHLPCHFKLKVIHSKSFSQDTYLKLPFWCKCPSTTLP